MSSEDEVGPGLEARDFMDNLSKMFGIEQTPGYRDMQAKLEFRAAADREMALKINRVFSKGEGAEVLDWLLGHTLRKDEVAVDLIFSHTPEQIQAHGFVRAGENSVVKLILLAMAQAQKKQPRRRKTP